MTDSLPSKDEVTIADFSAMVMRDAQSAPTWFTGPKSATAMAIRDRRDLIEGYSNCRREIARLLDEIAALKLARLGDCQHWEEKQRVANETIARLLSGKPEFPDETTAGQDPSPLGCGLPWPTCETCTAWHDVVADPIGPGTRNGECRLEPKPVAVTSTYWCRNWQGPKRTPGAPPLKASDAPETMRLSIGNPGTGQWHIGCDQSRDAGILRARGVATDRGFPMECQSCGRWGYFPRNFRGAVNVVVEGRSSQNGNGD